MNNDRNYTLGGFLETENVGLEAEEAILWPNDIEYSRSLLEDLGVEKVVGLSDVDYLDENPSDRHIIEITDVHNYDKSDFDLEYGRKISDDVLRSVSDELDEDLFEYDFPFIDEREHVLGNAFRRLAGNSDDLLKKEDSEVVYSMRGFTQYQLPRLESDRRANQVSYAEKISRYLEQEGFETEIIEKPDFSQNTHLIGRR